MRDARRPGQAGPFQLDAIAARVVEEPGSGPEQHRCQLELYLVHEPGSHELTGDVRPAHHEDVPLFRRLPRPPDRALESVGDEGEGPARHGQLLPVLMGDHEARRGERRVLPQAHPHVEGPPAHHHRPRRGGQIPMHLGVHIPVGVVVEQPFVEPLTAPAHGLFDADVGPGDEAVKRHRDVQKNRCHEIFPSLPGPRRRGPVAKVLVVRAPVVGTPADRRVSPLAGGRRAAPCRRPGHRVLRRPHRGTALRSYRAGASPVNSTAAVTANPAG